METLFSSLLEIVKAAGVLIEDFLLHLRREVLTGLKLVHVLGKFVISMRDI